MLSRCCRLLAVILALGASLVSGRYLAAATAPGRSSQIVTGRLSVTWVCGDATEEAPEYGVTDARGREWTLSLSPNLGLTYEQLQALVGRRVEVRGVHPGHGIDARGGSALVVNALAPLDGDLPPVGSAHIADVEKGTKNYATLLLRFADSTNITPKAPIFFKSLFATTSPGLDGYYRSISGNQINLAGSQNAVFGWFNLPRKLNDYIKADQSFDRELAVSDAVAVASSQVTFPNFFGFNLAFNVNPFPGDVVGFGGRRFLTIQGVERTWGVTWIAQHEQCVWAHELGHTLGLPHSSGPYNQIYDSKWDVMSQPFLGNSTLLGRIAEGSISYHFSLLGWIPDTRRVEVTSNTQADRVLDSISQLTVGTGPQFIRVPISADGKRFYTVEARRKVGFDATIPGEGVILHAVDSARRDRVAQVVDATSDLNPNDVGALWTTGETFTDLTNRVQVTVAAKTANGFRVLVSSGLLPPTELQAKVVSPNEVALSWKNNSASATGFVVQRRKESAPFADLAPLPAGATRFSDKTVEARTTYSYRLLVKGPAATTAVSLETMVTTRAAVTGKLSVSKSVNFGKVKVRKSRTKVLVIRNLSAGSPMEVSVQAIATPFSISSSSSFTVPAGGQSRLSLVFRPNAKKSFRGVLTLSTTDPQHLQAKVNLVGTGKK